MSEIVPPSRPALEGRYEIAPLAASDVGEKDLIAMWTREAGLSRERAEERVAEVSHVAVDEEDGLVGVCTVFVKDDAQLGLPLWNYRTFITRPHRNADLARTLLYHVMHRLRSRWESGEDRSARGMLIEAESRVLRQSQNFAVWETTRFIYIGTNAGGAQRRVLYFPGAEVERPVPGSDY